MKIAITGGKGGTGKSTLSTALALELSREHKLLLVDADVECPDDHIILSTTREKVKNVHAMLPSFNPENCSKCGNCLKVCRENAVVFIKDKYPFIVSRQCNGCGACILACPSSALKEGQQVIGAIYQGQHQQTPGRNSDKLLLVWGEIDVGCESTSHVVNATREYAANMVSDYDYVLIDTAAGTHCNVISAMIGVDLALAVTEPTPLGKHDLELILQLLKIMMIPTQIILNKSDIGDSNIIEEVSRDNNIPFIQKIPNERDIFKKHSRGQPVIHKTIEELAHTITVKFPGGTHK
jgi:MinD superfamily P-loop ATPase